MPAEVCRCKHITRGLPRNFRVQRRVVEPQLRVGVDKTWSGPGPVLTAAAAAAVAAAGIGDVEHVVICMQENRPFDHYYGMLQGVRGFNDPAAPLLPNGDPVWKQPLSVQPATARFCGCSACDLVWLQKGSEVQSMFDTFSCPTLAGCASGGKPPVPITQGELCSQVVKDLLTTDFENLRIADFLSPTSTHSAEHSAARTVQHAQCSAQCSAQRGGPQWHSL